MTSFCVIEHLPWHTGIKEVWTCVRSRSVFFVALQIKTFVRPCGEDLCPPLGTFCHMVLWREMCQATSCPDSLFHSSMVQGFPLLGNIELSHSWLASDSVSPPLFTPDEMLDRACGIREKVRLKLERHRGGGITQNKFGRRTWRMSQRSLPLVRSSALLRWTPSLEGRSGFPSLALELNNVERSDRLTTVHRQVLLETLGVRCPRTCRSQTSMRLCYSFVTLSVWVIDEKKALRQVPVLLIDILPLWCCRVFHYVLFTPLGLQPVS